MEPLRERVIEVITEALEDRNRIYGNESELQMHIAACLIKKQCFTNVFIEYAVPTEQLVDYPCFDQWISIDIVVEENNSYIPIEIKYHLTSGRYNLPLFGDDTEIALGHAGGQNNTRYGVWKDVSRNECLANSMKKVNMGVSLFLTNDEGYWKNDGKGCAYHQFNLQEKREVTSGTTLIWGDFSITLRNDYKIHWKNCTENLTGFKYLIL